jgi:hypothetical protein
MLSLNSIVVIITETPWQELNPHISLKTDNRKAPEGYTERVGIQVIPKFFYPVYSTAISKFNLKWFKSAMTNWRPAA